MFWTTKPPLGAVGTPRQKFIDVDEFGISLEKTNSRFGCASTCVRGSKVNEHARSTELTVLFAIEPGDARIPAGENVQLKIRGVG
mmetsp:Transcript_28758/g.40429  ORF Transcript_28758/g.40429 Transcript_28758/m.40429 type:complete len:85 (+) Transcript_28758:179-433(+)